MMEPYGSSKKCIKLNYVDSTPDAPDTPDAGCPDQINGNFIFQATNNRIGDDIEDDDEYGHDDDNNDESLMTDDSLAQSSSSVRLGR